MGKKHSCDAQELAKLRREIKALRKEKDSLSRDFENVTAKAESWINMKLQLTSDALSKEIRSEFYESVKRFLWVGGFLFAIATAGGFWKLSDIITNQVNEKMEKKDKNAETLRGKVIETLAISKARVDEAGKEFEEFRGQMRNERSVIVAMRYKLRGAIESVETESQHTLKKIGAIKARVCRPVITNLAAKPGSNNDWTFSATVVDGKPGGLTVQFGGIADLLGQTATVQSDGSASITLRLEPGSSGTVTAEVTNFEGVQSEPASLCLLDRKSGP